jgi:hypothetical protein
MLKLKDVKRICTNKIWFNQKLAIYQERVTNGKEIILEVEHRLNYEKKTFITDYHIYIDGIKQIDTKNLKKAVKKFNQIMKEII